MDVALALAAALCFALGTVLQQRAGLDRVLQPPIRQRAEAERDTTAAATS